MNPIVENKPHLDVLVQRQLDNVSSGNGVYLEMFLNQARRANMHVRVVFAPWHSFGNRPWCDFHERFEPLVDEIVWPRSVCVNGRYWSLSSRVWLRFFGRAFKELKRRAGMNSFVESYLGKPLSDEEAEIVAAQCNREPRDLTVAEYSSMGPVLDRITEPTKFAVLMHDLLSDRGPRFRQHGIEPDFVEITRQQEAEWVKRANLLIYASANEMQSFNPSVPQATPVWLRPEPPVYELEPARGAPKVVFIGTQHAGNGDAINHFIEDIWPLVKAKRPDMKLLIVGGVGQQVEIQQDEAAKLDVELLGRIERLEDVGGANSIGIAPTRLATGVSIKVVEYLMLGMPCIAYPLALEGFGDVLNELVVISDDCESYANEIIELAENKERRQAYSTRAINETANLMSNDELVACLQFFAKPEFDTEAGQLVGARS